MGYKKENAARKLWITPKEVNSRLTSTQKQLQGLSRIFKTKLSGEYFLCACSQFLSVFPLLKGSCAEHMCLLRIRQLTVVHIAKYADIP